MKDYLILSKFEEQMASIFNAKVGEVFTVVDVETIMILQRRLEESDLKRSLSIYNAIFSKIDGASLSDIKESASAFIRIRTLLSVEAENFDGKLYRQLVKEYRSQISKTKNLINVSKLNAMNAEQFQKAEIEAVLKKNEALLHKFEDEIALIEKSLEKTAPIKEVIEEEKVSEDLPKESTKIEPRVKPLDKITSVLEARRNQGGIKERLREEEISHSDTKLGEIAFYEKTLNFTESFVCKDIPSFSLLKRKENVFFGRSDHIKGNTYDNSDESLIELTKATDDFIQYMTCDILSGEYKLKPFTNAEKQSLGLYFNFMISCFEKYIGKLLTSYEFINFKTYYNKVVLTMFELERKFREDYYRALVLADSYMSYMSCYDLDFSDDKKVITKNIMDLKNKAYIEDLRLIREHHVIDGKACDTLEHLISDIEFFADEKEYYHEESVNEQIITQPIGISGRIDPTPESLDPAIHFKASEYNTGEAVTADDLRQVQIKIQFLNKEHVITDEALFAVTNVRTAVMDYLRRPAFIKKIGLYVSEKEIFLYSSKNGSLSVCVLTPEMKKIKHLDSGIQGQLVDFYEEQIRKTMIEIAM